MEGSRINKSQSKRPRDLKFIQQTLPTYYPLLTVGRVAPVFLVISLAFIPVGLKLFLIDRVEVREQEVDYSNCTSHEDNATKCEEIIKARMLRHLPPKVCACTVNFTLDESIDGTVYVYYGLTNFYQNHLKYYNVRDARQLAGELTRRNDQPRNTSSTCQNFSTLNVFEDGEVKPKHIYPCGILANSMFFDEIALKDENGTEVPLSRRGITGGRKSLRRNFKNPETLNDTRFTKPIDWPKNVWELDKDPENNGVQNEDFMVWMQAAAFPGFRKMYRILDSSDANYHDGLKAGEYSLHINYSFPTWQYEGRKSIILTNSKVTGAQYTFLAFAYFITGVILFVLSGIFTVIHCFTHRRYIHMIN